MDKSNSLPNGVINPFSDTFLDTWQLWKDFRWQEHKFKYKGNVSEQVRLIQLAELADKNEETAKAIVLQSIGQGWTGFYKLKTVKVSQDGSGKSKSANSSKETRQQVNDLYNSSSRKW